MKLGNRLKNFRLAYHLTHEEVREAIGDVTLRTIMFWESGDKMPNIKHLIDLARLYNVTLNELLGVQTVREEVEREAC